MILIKKALFTSVLLIVFQSLCAQIPEGYYETTEGLTGDELKEALHHIIDDHTEHSYNDLWSILTESDEDPNNSGNFILIYTGRSIAKSSVYPDWNREHVWAKSHGDFGNTPPAGSDAHHIRPSDVSVNGDRGNKDFDNGGTQHSEATECYYTSTTWEPRDAVKGDVARMMFYMTVRYEGDVSGEPDLELVDYITYSTSSPIFGKLSTLLEWHDQDPVDDFERNRNEVIYSYQNNRNPFVDHPEYVAQIWDGEENIPPSITSVSISPVSPTSADEVAVSASITDADGTVTNVDLHWGLASGSLSNIFSMTNTSGDTYTSVSEIPSQADGTTVYYKIEAEDDAAAINTSSTQSYTVYDGGAVSLPFEEDFETVNEYEPIDIGGWRIYNEAGTTSWEGREYNANKYAQMSAYNTGEATNISWLITPEVDLTDITSAQFSFKSKDAYNNGEVLTVMISYDYNGSGDPNMADWTELNPEIANNAPSNNYASEFVFSGELDISSYIGQTIYIAFKYVGGDGSVTTTMQVDDVLITADTTSNAAPEISNINYSPENPESQDSVYVSAAISDPDGSVNSATIKWGNSTEDYTSQEEMSLENENAYLGVIPPQQDQTWVYFIIEAEDNEEGITTSEEMSYQVVDPENQAPVISDVVLDPENPTENDNVVISASADDTDGAIESVILKWKKNDEAYHEQSMNLSGGKYYGQISKQASGVTINFSIIAIDDFGAESTYEDSYEVSEASSLENVKLSQVKIFPNPASSRTKVVIPGYTGTLNFKIFDAIGSLVLNETMSFDQEDIIELKGIISGIYFMRITNESGISITRRLLVNH